MKSKKRFFSLLLLLSFSGISVIAAFSIQEFKRPQGDDAAVEVAEAGCVFKTVFEDEALDTAFVLKTPEKVTRSLDGALSWLAKAQHNDGGWGAGSHNNQRERNPHAVDSDPATTAMVAMALLRSGNTPAAGVYSSNLNKAMNYLITVTESSPDNDLNITSITGTQPQRKLGQNVDAALAAQFFTNVLDHFAQDAQLQNRVRKCLDKCISKIQRAQESDGSIRGAGWAGVLQSSIANNALETAAMKGAKVNAGILEKSREYQKKNFDAKTGNVNTEMGAGVMLYSISGSSRATSKESRYAKEKLDEAKANGVLDKDEKVTVDNLKKSGMSESEALKYAAAYEINEAAKTRAQDDDVMLGFGNNGGEEFLSYLQTGEGLIMGKDAGWKKWYGNVTGTLIGIQNNDGSWHGHHCITSPVFCTATSVLILSVNNDVKELLTMGKN